MPMYSWKCTKCQEQLEILRSITDSDIPPKDEEEESLVPPFDTDTYKPCKHEWNRHIGHAPQKAYGANWGTRKGYH